MSNKNLGGIFLMDISKDLVISVCEPYITTQRVKSNRSTINLCVFGSFDLGESTRFLYGTEEDVYNSIFQNGDRTSFPLTFAEERIQPNGEASFTVQPINSFTDSELESIMDTIVYTLRSQEVMSHYASSRC
jgi:hypothetical protein